MSHVMTVRGAVEPTEIGPCLTHEHIWCDMSLGWNPDELHDPKLGGLPFEPRFGGLARWNGRSFKDDLRQDPIKEYDMVSEEVRGFVEAGGSCIVEMTNVGLNPSPQNLRKLSEDLDVHIVAGCGMYVHAFHPKWVCAANVDVLAQAILHDVQNGFDDTGIRAGLIGEIGTSETLQPCEERVLRAAARVAVTTSTPINIHANPPELPVMMRILDLLEEEGQDLQRTSVSHLDEIEDLDYHTQVLDRGVITGFDSFGQDGYFTPTWKSLSDLKKMSVMVSLIERGYEDQLVMSQDMGKKHYLLRFGGLGYDHVLRRIVPRLKEHFNISEEIVNKLLVDNPRRLLTREFGA